WEDFLDADVAVEVAAHADRHPGFFAQKFLAWAAADRTFKRRLLTAWLGVDYAVFHGEREALAKKTRQARPEDGPLPAPPMPDFQRDPDDPGTTTGQAGGGRCEVCGKALEGKRAHARYCTSACRQKAFRNRARTA